MIKAINGLLLSADFNHSIKFFSITKRRDFFVLVIVAWRWISLVSKLMFSHVIRCTSCGRIPANKHKAKYGVT